MLKNFEIQLKRTIFTKNIIMKELKCKECDSIYIANKFFMLCNTHNRERLNSNASTKTSKKRKPVKTTRKKNKTMLQKDNEFYQLCFDKFELDGHRCENCGINQPTDFRDGDWKIIARHRYSHIVPKSVSSKLRHNLENINDMCLSCHNDWDFLEDAEKEKMHIYKSNSEIEILKRYFIKF